MFFNFQTISKILTHRGVFTTATTIMAVEFDGGVVIGADSDSSARSFVVDRVFDKFTPVTDKIYCCHSGIAADGQAMLDHVACKMKYYGSPGPGRSPEVFRAACELRNKSYKNRDIWLAGLIVAGWDDTKGGQVYSIPMGGMLARVPYAIAGSGRSYSKGYVENHFKPGMDLKQCIELVTSAIRSDIRFDQSSGGVVCIGAIDKDGMKRHINNNTDCSPPDVSSGHSSFTFISSEREYTDCSQTDVSSGQSFTSFIRSLEEASNSQKS